ncbi:substrate-binding periplasmic protein, partial [Piscirickettsia litoralis]
LLFIKSATAHTTVMTISYDGKWPPYSYQLNSGKTKGILVDIVRIALSQADLQSEAVSFPAEQAEALVKGKIISALATVPNQKQREEMVASDPIFTIHSNAFVFKKNKKLADLKEIASLNSLKKFKVCDYKNNAWARQQFKIHKIKALFTQDQTECLRQIALGRYDLTISPKEIGDQLLMAMGLRKHFIALPYNYRSLAVVLLVDKHSELAESLPKFNQAIKEMRKNGTIKKVIDSYIQ